jgi:hydroxymethylpyrimidine pyrophosphatase-like HAD family hydrolase
VVNSNPHQRLELGGGKTIFAKASQSTASLVTIPSHSASFLSKSDTLASAGATAFSALRSTTSLFRFGPIVCSTSQEVKARSQRAIRNRSLALLAKASSSFPQSGSVLVASKQRMRYLALATDYDGTLASEGRVDGATIKALEEAKSSGRKLLLVTGRHRKDLESVFQPVDLFDRVVVENGAVVYDPISREEKLLAESPPEQLLAALRESGVPAEAGRAIISSWVPHQTAILEAIHRLGLDYQVIFNKGAVMVLPSGVNKATGLRAALQELGLSLHNAVAIGDGENDHTFLSASECGVAVANGVATLRERADIVTSAQSGAGVIELIHQLLRDDLTRFDDLLVRHAIVLGARVGQPDAQIRMIPARNSMLIAGASASGKSTVVAGILERLTEQDYQFCLIDPEGDYENFANAVVLGSPKERPDPDAVSKALGSSPNSVIVNLMAISLRERPEAFATLLPKIADVRGRTGRPHWLVIDEAHHLMPTSWSVSAGPVTQALQNAILVTVHPEHVWPAALSNVDVAIATGKTAFDALSSYARTIHIAPPPGSVAQPEPGLALIWFSHRRDPPILATTWPAKVDRKRHRRNYAAGELSPEQSFFFRGPQSKLNLRAQNLMIFLQLAEGLDDETWMFHLHNGDYSRWFQETIKDTELAASVRAIEQDENLSPAESRSQIKAIVESLYTAPA